MTHRSALTQSCLVLALWMPIPAAGAQPASETAAEVDAARAAPAPAAAIDLTRKQSQQLRARELARDLLGSIIDQQLVRLEENGLGDDALYQELQAMRQRVGRIADQRMPEVVQLLSAAASAEGEQRRALVDEAQEAVHQTLLQLLAERERVRMRLRRMQIEDLAVKLRDEQTQTRNATRMLGAEDDAALTLVAGSQRNVAALAEQWLRLLDAAQQWSGPDAEAAQKMREGLGRDRLEADMVAAHEALIGGRYAEAAQRQQAVIEAVEAALASLRSLDEGEDAEQGAALRDQLTALRDRQAAVAEDLASETELTAVADAYVAREAAIRDQLRGFAAEPSLDPSVKQKLDQAAEQADAARRAAFVGDQPETEASMRRAAETIDEAIARLDDAQLAPPAGLRAAKAALAEVQKLTEARQALEKAEPAQARAVAKAKSKADEAARSQAQAREQTATARKIDGLPGPVAEAIKRADDAAKRAEHTLRRGHDDRAKRAAEAGTALAQAVGEVKQAEREAKREAEALALGELNRAAEALDRAAAASRDVSEQPARTAADARSSEALDKARQIAERVNEGVRDLVPSAEQPLKNAEAKLAEASKRMPPADAQPKEQAPRARPADWQKPAGDASDQLADAADAIRQEMQQRAEALDQTLAASATELGGLSERLAQLPPEPPRQANEPEGPAPSVAPAMEEAAREAAKVSPEVAEALRSTPEPSSSPASAEPEASRSPASPALRAQAVSQMQREQIQAQRQEARRIASAAQAQRDSAKRIREARQQAQAAAEQAAEQSDASGSPEPESGGSEQAASEAQPAAASARAMREAGAELAEATDEHARALREAGEEAAAASGQEELGNEPVREASQIAASLGEPTPAGPAMAQAPSPEQSPTYPTPGQNAESTPTPESAEQSTPTPGSQSPAPGSQCPAPGSQFPAPAPGSHTPGAPSPGALTPPTPGTPTPGSSAPGAPMPGSAVAGTPMPSASPTGMVPHAPAQTAAMMAGAPGQAAMAQMAAAPGTTPATTPGTAPGEADPMPGQSSQPPPPAPGAAAPGSAGGSSQPGQFVENPDRAEGEATFAEDTNDTSATEPGGREAARQTASIPRGPESWATGLPEGVREAIRSGQKSEPPRGYEQRLQDYFESVD